MRNPKPVAVADAASAAQSSDAAHKLTITEIALVVTAVVACIAAARVAQPFLVPIVTGILLSYTLRPLVSLLERARLPRLLAA